MCIVISLVSIGSVAGKSRPEQTFDYIVVSRMLDEGFSMRATAQGFGVGLTLARVDKPLKEEAVGC